MHNVFCKLTILLRQVYIFEKKVLTLKYTLFLYIFNNTYNAYLFTGRLR